jgi:hypothetical protein
MYSAVVTNLSNALYPSLGHRLSKNSNTGLSLTRNVLVYPHPRMSVENGPPLNVDLVNNKEWSQGIP